MKTEPLQQKNHTDKEGMPAGGVHVSPGCVIAWQDGPLGRAGKRREPNGAFVENVLRASRDRIEWYQTVNGGCFACEENAIALEHLDAALEALDLRTKRREAAGTEGTHAED